MMHIHTARISLRLALMMTSIFASAMKEDKPSLNEETLYPYRLSKTIKNFGPETPPGYLSLSQEKCLFGYEKAVKIYDITNNTFVSIPNRVGGSLAIASITFDGRNPLLAIPVYYPKKETTILPYWSITNPETTHTLPVNPLCTTATSTTIFCGPAGEDLTGWDAETQKKILEYKLISPNNTGVLFITADESTSSLAISTGKATQMIFDIRSRKITLAQQYNSWAPLSGLQYSADKSKICMVAQKIPAYLPFLVMLDIRTRKYLEKPIEDKKIFSNGSTRIPLLSNGNFFAGSLLSGRIVGGSIDDLSQPLKDVVSPEALTKTLDTIDVTPDGQTIYAASSSASSYEIKIYHKNSRSKETL